MSRTQLTGKQISNSSVQRDDLDSVTAGQAVIKKIIAGSGIDITFTGTDSGTGDVTIVSNQIVTKASIGLGSVDNTSDIDKPVSTQQALAIAAASSDALVYALIFGID